MNLKITAGLFCVLLAPMRGAHAQDSLSIDPQIEWVVAGGRWTASGHVGNYRVIIRTGGLEHVVSSLTIEWIAEAERGELSVFRSLVVPDLDGVGRLDRPKIGQYLKGWRVWVEQTDTHSSGQRTTTRAIDLGPPGVVKVRPVP